MSEGPGVRRSGSGRPPSPDDGERRLSGQAGKIFEKIGISRLQRETPGVELLASSSDELQRIFDKFRCGCVGMTNSQASFSSSRFFWKKWENYNSMSA